MTWDEIEVPKEIRPFMLGDAEETRLGQKNGADKQYRYGNLHIREYDDKYLVHMDEIDPRKDPLGHLLVDAPEVLLVLHRHFLEENKLHHKYIKYKITQRLQKAHRYLAVFLHQLHLVMLDILLLKKLKIFRSDLTFQNLGQ